MSLVKIPDLGGATIQALEVGGFVQPYFFRPPEETQRIFEAVPSFTFRDDDVMLCSYPKTGTNWLFEVLMMMLNRSSQRVEKIKDDTMLELSTAEEVNQVPSPRVVNCHYPPRYLPLNSMRKKQIKTVLCQRNPKDTAVSYYNHMKGIKTYDYSGEWKDWLPLYMAGKLEYGKHSNYVLEWEKIIDHEAGFPLHIVYFEDLKKFGPRELDKLMTFLGIELESKLKEDILDKCTFGNMAREKMLGSEEEKEMFFKNDFNFFRKGEVGDWKNWFTVAQNEQFDQQWAEEMGQSKMSTFVYS